MYTKNKRLMTVVLTSFMLLFTFHSGASHPTVDAQSIQLAASHKGSTTATQKKMKPENKDQELTDEKIKRMTSLFMEKLVQDTNEDYKVLNYDSKAELIQSFESISSKTLAKKYVDFYYKEYDDGLYLIPMDTPPWFDPQQNYEITNVSSNEVQLKQDNKNELYGDYSISMTFSKEEGSWKLVDVVHS
ncbi:hypothetical protein N781_07400 [Pontibacillus halophilus JSM 076056 = DSM 19796]|uniref:DUF3993 domain-containing protein n=1 Tax=Pontibacillus halophilus JSM 076056 = DSM 19796 TaxID=1385510 RepID=A0A0A5GEJ4_9BACI|nr:hypothetical protein [Pontibacillus halophilus]KGX89530.1 hypothetical protein N781_07400 [Pontibacillus halophilus JSM 076056 = DSM 19796]